MISANRPAWQMPFVYYGYRLKNPSKAAKDAP